MNIPLYYRLGLLKRDLIALYEIVSKRATALRNYPDDLDGDYTYYLRTGKLASSMMLAKALDIEYYMSLCRPGEYEPRELALLIEPDYWSCILPALYSFANLLNTKKNDMDLSGRLMRLNQLTQEFCIAHNYYFSSYISSNDSIKGVLKVSMDWQLECKGENATDNNRIHGKIILDQKMKNSDILKCICIQALTNALKGTHELQLFNNDAKFYLEKTKTILGNY